MRAVLKPILMVAFILIALPVSAQRSGRTQDPTLNKGEGLEMNRKDLDKMRNQKQDKNARQVNVYMFAACFSLLDSVMYVSDIQLVNDVTVNNKWFVKERLAFEKQFTDFVAGTDEGAESYMTSLQFSEKEKKLQKNKSRLIKRSQKKNGFKYYQISGFRFENPVSVEQD
jgi:hypothetical protein